MNKVIINILKSAWPVVLTFLTILGLSLWDPFHIVKEENLTPLWVYMLPPLVIFISIMLWVNRKK